LPAEEKKEPRVLDFDIETLAAGYADPGWVPDKITAVAWSWVGEEDVDSIVRPDGFFDRGVRGTMVAHLLGLIRQADIVQGHNIVRFDLRVINAEAMRLKLRPIRKLKVLDTIQVLKSKGFKKGQDDIAALLKIPSPKKKLNWQEWDDAYEEGHPWPTVKERVEGDVLQHRLLTAAMREKGWLKGTKDWVA
jgi:DNA polymerase elongation subunit (family B)